MGDADELTKIYDFAEWCFRQKANDLWNAAGVSFYEHLVDHPETRQGIPRYLKPDIFEDVAGLFEWRLGREGMARLREDYERYQCGTGESASPNCRSAAP